MDQVPIEQLVGAAGGTATVQKDGGTKFHLSAAALQWLVDYVRNSELEAMMQLFTDPENQPTQHGTVTLEYMQQEIKAEREACAKVAENCFEGRGNNGALIMGVESAKAIRARGQA
jgi:hypothetical protein